MLLKKKSSIVPYIGWDLEKFDEAISGFKPKYLKLDGEKLIELLYEVPDIAMMVNYYANQISKVKYNLYKIKGNDKELIQQHPLLDLLAEPNELQSYYEFIRQFISYLKIEGNGYINAFSPANKKEPSKLFVLPSQYIEIETERKKGDFRTNSIKNYKLDLFDYNLTIPAEEVMHKKETNLKFKDGNYYKGASPFLSCNKPISSLVAIYEAKVTIYERKGALGIITGNSGGADFIPPSDHDIADVQEKFDNYGLSRNQYQYIITKAALQYQQMGMDVQEMQLVENSKEDRKTIANVLGLPSIIFDDDNSSFNNKKEANIEVWNRSLIPFTNDLFNDFTNFFRRLYSDDTLLLSADYSDIEELQEDEKQKHDMLMDDIEHAVRTPNEVRVLKGESEIDNPQADNLYMLNRVENIEGEESNQD